MENNKTTLYLGALCIVLVIWGSIIDGKRHIVEKELALEKSVITSAKETAEQKESENAKLNKTLAKLNTKLSKVGDELDSCGSELETARAELEKLSVSNSELKAKLEEKTVSMVRLSKVNALLKQRIQSFSSSLSSHEASEIERQLAEKSEEIERLESELADAMREIERLRGSCAAKAGSSMSEGAAGCSRMSELEKACDSRTRICNRARTQLSSALRDCKKSLEMSEKNRGLLSEKVAQCRDSSEIEMCRLNVSVLLARIQQQNGIISDLKARLQ